MIEQSLAVAGMLHGAEQIRLQEQINPPGGLGGVRGLSRSVVGPKSFAERAGGQRVFQRSLVVGAAANQNQMRWQCAPDPVDDGPQIQKRADQNGVGMGAGMQRAG